MVRWLNIAKGLGIIFIVLGHSHAPYPFYSFFYYFHIPLFFFISGYLFNKKQPPITTFIKNKFKNHMYPYLSYGFIFTILMILLDFFTENLNYNKTLILFEGYFFGKVDYMANKNLWFLPSLFITVCLARIIIFYFKRFLNDFRVTFLYAFLLSSIYLCNGLENYFMTITTIPVSLLFFLIGYHYKTLEVYEFSVNWFKVLVISFLTFTSFYFSYTLFDHTLDVGNTRYRPSLILLLLNALLGIYLTIKFSQVLRQNALLEYLGKISLYIFILHQVFIPLINKIYESLNYNGFWILTAFIKISLSVIIYEFFIKKIKKQKIGIYF